MTGTAVDLGGKEPYDPNVARARAHRHAGDLVTMPIRLASATRPAGGRVVVSPFDTELFGHWWSEGVDFLGDLYRALARQDANHPVTAANPSGSTATARGNARAGSAPRQEVDSMLPPGVRTTKKKDNKIVNPLRLNIII